jgi:hypothetical protein
MKKTQLKNIIRETIKKLQQEKVSFPVDCRWCENDPNYVGDIEVNCVRKRCGKNCGSCPPGCKCSSVRRQGSYTHTEPFIKREQFEPEDRLDITPDKEMGDLSIGEPKPLAKGGPILSHGTITGLTCAQITQGDTCAANAVFLGTMSGPSHFPGFSKDNSVPFTTSDIGEIFYRHISGDPFEMRFKLCDIQDPRTAAQNSHSYWFYPPGAYWWYMLANPGRSNGAYYHQIGGGCECCHDPVANPCQNSTQNWNCNTPPQDWNQPFNPPMTPICLHPGDPQYQVGYPCDCYTSGTGCH